MDEFYERSTLFRSKHSNDSSVFFICCAYFEIKINLKYYKSVLQNLGNTPSVQNIRVKL